MKTQDTDVVQSDFSRPLVVSPRQACRLLSVGLTRLYEILNAGKLDSFMVGRSPRITLASIHAYIELNRAAACAMPTLIGNRRVRSDNPRSEIIALETTFADTAVSMSKVIEAMTESVMQAMAREMSNLGCKGDSGDDRALREVVYTVVSRDVIQAAVRKMNETLAQNPFYRRA
jgi:excisionase family DNA binding protein